MGTKRAQARQLGKKIQRRDVQLKIGDRVSWHADYTLSRGASKDTPAGTLAPGDIGTVTEVHPAQQGTGRVLDHDEQGEPIVDDGSSGWAKIVFSPAWSRAIEQEDIESGLVKRLP